MIQNLAFLQQLKKRTWASYCRSLENDLVDAGQLVRLRIPEGPLEQVLESWAEPPVAAVDQHGQVLGDDRWRGAVVQLQQIVFAFLKQLPMLMNCLTHLLQVQTKFV